MHVYNIFCESAIAQEAVTQNDQKRVFKSVDECLDYGFAHKGLKFMDKWEG